jgi:hypothetical protein
VAKEFPKARTISFNFLVNFENLRTTEPGYDLNDWNAFVNATLIQVDKPSDLKVIEQRMEKYKSLQNKVADEDWAISSFAFEPLATLHRRSEYITDDISRSSASNYTTIIFNVIVAVFLLALACFNYINIAIATAAKRLKEIGIRKSIGASRRIVIIQFLTENMVITFFALVIGLIIGYAVFITGFERLWSFNMDFRLDDRNLWIYLPVILIVTSIASGIYPALYISRFQVVRILKGSVTFGQSNLLTKVFLALQLVLACMFITMSVMFTQNTSYLNERSWGYERANVIYAMVPDQSAFEALSTLMAREADVVSTAGSAHHVAKSHASLILHFPDRDYEVNRLAVDAKYFETLGLEMKDGRGFHDHEGSDKQAVVVNESMVSNMGWTKPVGKQFMIDSLQYEIVGVLNDFHSYEFSQQIAPTVFTVAEKSAHRYLSIRVKSGSEIENYKKLQAHWTSLFPEIPFEGGMQEDAWGFYYEEIAIYVLVWRVFAFIAVSLAVLGLYGLIKLNVEGRTKEFSIRKVLGAGVKNITGSIANPFVILFASALIIGAPLGHVLAKFTIEMTSIYHMPVTFSSVTIGVGILTVVLLATVATQVRKVLKTNPVNGLKVE